MKQLLTRFGFRKPELRAGDWVEVKSAAEIAATLDSNSTLEGLPFMPEMAEFCGGRFRVVRRAEKACVEHLGFKYDMREFRHSNVVILDVSRCSGTHHDGCQRACILFWKTEWLRKSAAVPARQRQDFIAIDRLRSALKTTVAPGQYFCQSTEMDNATQVLSRARIVLKCFSDLRSGSRTIFEMPRLMLFPLFRYITRYKFPRPLVGTQKQTPVCHLGLQPGEWVEVRSENEILQSLDAHGRNRGLVCDRGLTQYAGRTFRVLSRLDHMISEPTGKMRAMESTVILEGLHCICWWRRIGGCPRNDFMWWREIWLKRATAPGQTEPPLRHGDVLQRG